MRFDGSPQPGPGTAAASEIEESGQAGLEAGKDVTTLLGLPIARQIAFAHGGTIEIQTEVGVGTTVTVWLSARATAR